MTTGASGAATAPAAARETDVARLLLLGIVAVASIVGAVVLLRFLIWSEHHEWTDDARVDADQVTVTSKIAERVDRLFADTDQFVHRGAPLMVLNDVDERTRLAQAVAQRDAQIATTTAAEQNALLTRDTQQAQIEENRGSIEQTRAAISAATHDREVTRQQLRAAERAIATARAQLLVAAAAVPSARAELAKALRDVERGKQLVTQGFLADQQLDTYISVAADARARLSEAESTEVAARSTVASAQAQLAGEFAALSSAGSKVDEQRGTLENAVGHLSEAATIQRVPVMRAQETADQRQVVNLAAAVRSARDQLSYTRIVSPVDGYIGMKQVEIGATVAAGQALMTIIPAHGIYVTANYRETQIGRMRVGLPVHIHVDAYGNRDFVGHIARLGPAANNVYTVVSAQSANGNFVKVSQRVPIRISVDRGADVVHPLRPGMSVETTVDL